MRRHLRTLVTAMAMGAISTAGLAAPNASCTADAGNQALKLLRFHNNNDDRAMIDPGSVRQIGTVASLVGKRLFDVIEAEGSIYKGEYRIRLIYAPMPGSCVLMGQEIFERSDPY